MGVSLRVVRFRGTVLRETHQLACCIAISPSLSRVVYSDHEVVCNNMDLIKTEETSLVTMTSKAHVFAAVTRDVDALRAKLPQYSQVWSTTSACSHDVHRTCSAPPWMHMPACMTP